MTCTRPQAATPNSSCIAGVDHTWQSMRRATRSLKTREGIEETLNMASNTSCTDAAQP